MEAKQYYASLTASARAERSRLSRSITLISTLRLATVIAAIAAVWIFWSCTPAVIGIILVAIAAFLFLVKYHDRLFSARAMQDALIAIAGDGLARIALDLKKMPSGERYISSRHQYTYDLDVFGTDSLFSLLSSTATVAGSDLLAQHLAAPDSLRTSIAMRQQAIKELSENVDFRTHFRALGIMAQNENADSVPLDFSKIPDFKISGWQRAVTWIAPSAMGVLIILEAIGVAVTPLLIFAIIVSIVLAGIGAKRVGHLHSALDTIVKQISVFHSLLRQIEDTDFNSPLLISLQGGLRTGEVTASVASERLARILTNLDQRYNWLSYLILNCLLQWDYRQIINAGRWMKLYRQSLSDWQNVLSSFDELSALATFSFHNPDYCFPEVVADGDSTVIEAVQMGHPLIPSQRCVCNDVRSMAAGDFMVVTGANMAGKSTYLRTVGVNYLLALIGAPVFAKSMRFKPVTLFTGLRTSDSLHDNESYFFAELSRLQSIVRRATAGEPMFVILDEILRGTNSIDKQKGSLALVSKLTALGVTGIIATHDLTLGTLADKFPRHVFNRCFEAEIEGTTMKFSYLLQPGIAKNMNASFLMRQMGIT
jgi:hypothetical protein